MQSDGSIPLPSQPTAVTYQQKLCPFHPPSASPNVRTDTAKKNETKQNKTKKSSLFVPGRSLEGCGQFRRKSMLPPEYLARSPVSVAICVDHSLERDLHQERCYPGDCWWMRMTTGVAPSAVTLRGCVRPLSGNGCILYATITVGQSMPTHLSSAQDFFHTSTWFIPPICSRQKKKIQLHSLPKDRVKKALLTSF